MADADPTITATFTPAHGADPTLTRIPDTDPPTPRGLGAPPVVPGYQIETELGRGGMGVVYRARDVKLDRLVALKIVLGGGHASSSAVARFAIEARAAAAVHHPGIAQVYELGESDGLPFLAMEFCSGGSLADALAGTPLPAHRAAELVAHVAGAVHAAHRTGVIHRDLKPANILLTGDGVPRVCDFGLASQGDQGSGLTASGAVLGSPSYMAPEQARGRGDVGPGADVYGLGAILYECLTGRPPFRAATPLETIRQVLADDPVPPARLVPGVPRDLETVCLKCLQKEPARRYSSAAALADDLRRFLDGRPVAARPVGALERTRKWVRRRPVVAAAIAAAIVAAATVLGAVAWTNQRLQRERDLARGAERDAEHQRGVAESERDRADAVRERAESRLVVALDAVERMMVRTAGEKWARDPALQAERRAVLEDAIAVYRSLPAEDGRDPRVRRQTALTEVRLATAYLALADYERAGRAVAEARAALTELVAGAPGDPGLAHDLATALIQAGHVDVLSARYDAAGGNYARAAEQARRATELAPERAEFRVSLAEALTCQGHFGSGARAADEGAKYHTAVVELMRPLVSGPESGYGATLFLAVGLTNIGADDAARGRPRASERLSEAEELLTRLSRQRAPLARWADVYDTCRGQALVARAGLSGQAPDEALARIDAAVAVFDTLLGTQPRSFPHQLQKHNALSARVAILVRAGRHGDARRAAREAAGLGGAIAAGSPTMGWVRYRFVIRQSVSLVERCRAGDVTELEGWVTDLLGFLPPTRAPEAARNGFADTVRYNVACAWAQASRFGPPADRECAAVTAEGALAELARDGYFGPVDKAAMADTDGDLEPLRGREGFERFRAGLKIAPTSTP